MKMKKQEGNRPSAVNRTHASRKVDDVERPVEIDRAARKRLQNRISQRCIREKGAAQSQHLSSFVALIRASQSGGDDNQAALIQSCLEILEENQRLKTALLRLRKKLFSVSNSAQAAADDDIFREILNHKMPRISESTISDSTMNSTEASEPTSGVVERTTSTVRMTSVATSPLDWSTAVAPTTSGASSWSAFTQSASSDYSARFSDALDTSLDAFSFDLSNGRPAEDDVWNVDTEHTITSQTCDEPFLDLASLFSSDQLPQLGPRNLCLGVLHSQTAGSAFLSPRSVTEQLEKICVFHICQSSNVGYSSIDATGYHGQHSLEPRHGRRFADRLVSDVAQVAVKLICSLAGMESYIYGTGASPPMELVLRWRLNPDLKNRLAIPQPFTPTILQCSSQDYPLVIDFVNWPTLRDQLIRQYQRLDIDRIIGDIVLNTVIDVPRLRVSLGVLDLFRSKVLPKMDSTAPTERNLNANDHPGRIPTRNLPAHETLEQHLLKGIRSYMAAIVETRKVKAMSVDESMPIPFQSIPKHPLSSQLGIDRLDQWRLNKDFSTKYPFLDSSACWAVYPTISMMSLTSV